MTSSSAPHHLANITSHGGSVPQISAATSAWAYYCNGLGYEDIAVRMYGQANAESVAKVRKLIEQGRAKALGAH